LEIWLELLQRHGIDEVLINTHYLAPQVRSFAAKWSGPPRISVTFEDQLLGSAGTIARNWDFVAGEDDFLVCYADNLTDIDLGRLLLSHRTHPGVGTMALFPSDRPRQCGIAELDHRSFVVGFEEKPCEPKSPYANAGVYVMSSTIRSFLPGSVPSDIAKDMLPQCLGRFRGWLWEGLMLDIGAPEAYERAQTLWAGRRGAAGVRPGEPRYEGCVQALPIEETRGVHQ
jgi:mannose-1-phosphate guanylyltransferase